MKPIFLLTALVTLSQCYKERIINGQEARAGQYPFAAAIYVTTSDGTYFCGGTLYTSQRIITAGQCVNNAVTFTIYLGTNNIKSFDSTTLKLASEEYFLHPDFNPLTLENDIGLIKLRMPVEMGGYIQPVYSLASSNLTEGATHLEIIGWGQTSNDAPGLQDHLQFHKLMTSLPNDECKMFYGNQVNENMVCVAGSYNEGACTGDSGSPLLQYVRGVYSYHVGVMSFVSSNGCESTDPSGYTRTYPYVNWIKNVTNT